MVIDYLDVESLAALKAETDAPLVVDANAPLMLSVAFQGFQPILGRNPQVLQAPRDIKLRQFSERHPFNIDETWNSLTSEQGLRFAAFERFDHDNNTDERR